MNNPQVPGVPGQGNAVSGYCDKGSGNRVTTIVVGVDNSSVADPETRGVVWIGLQRRDGRRAGRYRQRVRGRQILSTSPP